MSRIINCASLVFVIASISIASCYAEDILAENERPNVIIIYTDDHGYSDLSCQGVYDDVKTPNIDSLAANGVHALNGYCTAPQCVPSRGGLMIGKSQNRFGLEDNKSNKDGFNAEITIADRLKEAGYVTAQFGKWHLGGTSLITDHGFSHVFAQSGSGAFNANITYEGTDRPMGSLNSQMYHIDGCSYAASKIIERYSDKPFFLYIAYRAPHVPLDATEKYLSRFPGEMPERRRKALAMISAMDDGVGLITQTLKDEGLLEKTLIFVVSDNGAPLKINKEDEPGIGPGWDGSLNDPMNGEKGMLTEGGIHVPFVISWKGKIPGGQEYKYPVSTLDLGATAAALAGIEVDSGELDGVNLIPYLTGEIESPPHDALMWRWVGQSAIRAGKWKLLRGDAREYLFDLENDIEEKNNLLSDHLGIADSLRTLLSEWTSELDPPGLAPVNMSAAGNKYFDYYLDGILGILENPEWKFYTLEDWTLNDRIKGEVNDGVAKLEILGTDPFMNYSGKTVSLDPSVYRYLKIIARNNTNGGNGQFYFKNNIDNQFVRINIDYNENESEFSEYTIDLSKNEDWKGTITLLRLDPPGSSGTFFLDYLALIKDTCYSLTVNNGTGGGSFTEGTLVNIAADPPQEGQKFSAWTGDVTNVDDIYDDTTTLTMPAAAVELTATYSPISSVDMVRTSSKDLDVQIFPNPAKGTVNIKKTGIFEIVVFDVVGQTMYNKQDAATSCKIDVSHWKSGVYFVNIQCAGMAYNKKLIVE